MDERYAAAPSPWPKVFIVIAGVLIVALASWLVWAIWERSTPEVTSKLTSWKVVDEHTATATLMVDLSDRVEHPSCLLRAFAEDHSSVGDAPFTPVDGANEVTIRTERLATSIESVGCTTDGQNDAR
ncbi:DUF4307 domain-containing protein [Nocardioides sp.]|uniref:DUF4307 domain-containing protein n=1 Tax=Nocardioides sp. TaxID=35761 RepID=UPI0039E40CA4